MSANEILLEHKKLSARLRLLPRIEQRGIELIPEDARRSKPSDLCVVFFGTQMTYGSLVIGALPVAFGLNWLGSLTAILLGVVVGSIAVAAMSVMGPKAGTNSTVSSSAFFGVRGRYISSFITQVIDLGYFAMILWVSAPPLVQVGHLLLGLPAGDTSITIALIGIAFVVIAIGVLGHDTLVAYERFTAVGSLFCILLLVAFCISHFKPASAATFGLMLRTWWPTWILALTVQISNAISYAPFAGDYARYIPAQTPSKRVFLWTFLGMFAGCTLSCVAGELIALSVSDPNAAISLMFKNVPHALILPIVLVGLIGNASNGGMVVYNGTLDLQALLWKLKRVHVGLLFGSLGLVVAYLGLIAYDLTNSILALCAIVTILVTPWTVINVIGYLRHGQKLNATELQAFSSHREHGMYWYNNGFNMPAVAAWMLGVIVGMMFSDTALFVGPLSQDAKGVDLSFLSAAFVGGTVYLILDRFIPHANRTSHRVSVAAKRTI